MALSNQLGAMVVSTGNKSEMAVGYSTLYGDLVGGFSLLKDVYKTEVYKLSNYRNSITNVIPKNIINKKPSAELREEQYDSDTLPTPRRYAPANRRTGPPPGQATRARSLGTDLTSRRASAAGRTAARRWPRS